MVEASAWQPIRTALADALSLAFPVACAGCADADGPLCPSCREALRPAVTGRTLASGLAVSSGLAFDGAAARVIRCLKEEGRTSLARALAPALRAAVAEASDFDAVVVLPTSRAAMRRRGYRVPELLARRAGLRPWPLLANARSIADQRRLGRDERARNVAGSMVARDAAGLRVLLVDDVVTTGATLEEAARALAAAGAAVIGAATVAATPLRGTGWADALRTRR